MHIQNLLAADIDMKRIDDKPKYSGWVANLSNKFGAKKLGFHLEVMDPKTFSAPYHWHTTEEECFYVLEGEAVLRREDQFRKVGPGDFFFYEVGPQSVHHMYNHTDKLFKFIAVSISDPDGDVCFYPDSKKRTNFGASGCIQNEKLVPYFTDEEDPTKYWPDHALRGEV